MEDARGVLGSVLCLHGLGGGPYELGPLVEALREAGRRVDAPALPGHEGPGPAMPASTWPEWVAAAEAWFDDLNSGDRPPAVLGFSTGAIIALHLATRREVDRLVLLAPFLAIRYTGWLPFHPAPILRATAWLTPVVPRRSPPVRDPAMKAEAAKLDRFRNFNLHAALSALDLIEVVKPRVGSIQAPALIIQGRLDTVVEPSGAAWLHRHIGSTEKHLIELPATDHLIALDRDRERVIEAVESFLAGR